MKKVILGLGLAIGLCAVASTNASAGVGFSFGFSTGRHWGGPRGYVSYGYSYCPPPVVYAPAPVYYYSAPVYRPVVVVRPGYYYRGGCWYRY